jgi:Cys-rich repeat protein
MRKLSPLFLLVALCCPPLLIACGSGTDTGTSADDLENAKKHKCQKDSDCKHGQVCHAGTCQPAPAQCHANSDCHNGQVCVSNACQACTASSQCDAGQVCTNGQCGTPPPPPPQCHSNGDCGNGQVCLNGSCQACTDSSQCSSGQSCQGGQCVASGGPTPNPPPASCDQRTPGKTSIQALISVGTYRGLIHGFNGDHEIFDGTITNTVWVYDAKLIDTQSVQVAMNVHSAKDPSGLPQEIPLSSGQVLEVEGEYIPASAANAHGEAVVHYTHSPCGYVVINGTKYQ